MSYYKELIKFLEQAKTTNLTYKDYSINYLDTLVKASFGKGSSAKIPWVSFLFGNNTTSKGIYPVYLYFKDKEILILAYGISEENTPQNNWPDSILNNKSTIENYFMNEYGVKPYRYGSSYISKVYNVKEILAGNDINLFIRIDQDLNNIINEYKSVFKIDNYKVSVTGYNDDDYNVDENDEDIKTIITTFSKSINESGLRFSESIITRFIGSLLTKPFVLLTGLSGSGKTKIAQSFAKWMCKDDNQYKIIPVGSDWTNREPLLGFPNGLNNMEYVLPDSGVLDILIEANENIYKPYFLILDEMNLSHVERYFADFLSVLESDQEIMLYSGEKRNSSNNKPIPKKIKWPKNLFIIGTVNIDETTYMFSPKVLDRANTIEFRVDKNDIDEFLSAPKTIDLSKLIAKGKKYSSCFMDNSKQIDVSKNEELKKVFVSFFDELKIVGAEFGYRTAIEMILLIEKIKIIKTDISNDDCIDIAIMQKLLPKLHGSRNKISKILDKIIKLCLNDNVEFDIAKTEDITEKDIKYRISYEKLVRMYKNAIDNGFTSYAEA